MDQFEVGQKRKSEILTGPLGVGPLGVGPLGVPLPVACGMGFRGRLIDGAKERGARYVDPPRRLTKLIAEAMTCAMTSAMPWRVLSSMFFERRCVSDKGHT